MLTTLTILFQFLCLTIVSAYLYNKVRKIYLRIFQIESRLTKQQIPTIFLSRSVCLAEARARVANCPIHLSTYSQHGEELFIWQLFDFKLSGSFIEIGAYDGIRLSNSYFFEQIGWEGLLIEAHPELVKQCELNRPNAKTIHCALGSKDGEFTSFHMVRGQDGLDTLSFMTATDAHLRRVYSHGGIINSINVPTRTLDSVLEEFQISNPDVISIDIEGAELEVLKGINFLKCQPKLFIIENNDPLVPDFLRKNGYKDIMSIGCNTFYLKN